MRYTDDELIEGCLRGDRKLQKALYEKYASRMLGVCLRYAEHREEAEDMLQEGFIKVFHSISTYEKRGSFEGWIRRVMVFTSINIYKSRLRNYKEEQMTEYFDEPVNETIIDRLSAKEIVALIQQLPEGYRIIFNLFAVEGYTHKEIAEELGIAIGTSKSQFARARGYLQQLIFKQNKELYEQLARSG